MAFGFPEKVIRINNTFFDYQIRNLPQPEPSSVPVIVAVDEKSLASYGQWPWPRYRLAQLLDRLIQFDVAAVGIDILFPERDRSSPLEVQRELKQAFDFDLRLDEIPLPMRDYDRFLANVLESGPFVLAYYFEYGRSQKGDCNPDSANIGNLSRSMPQVDVAAERVTGILCSVAVIGGTAAKGGFINTQPDNDGLFRRTPLLLERQIDSEGTPKVYTSLALQTLMSAMRIDQATLLSDSWGDLNLTMKDRKVPLDSNGNLLIRFRGSHGRYRWLSAADVLEGRVNPTHLAGKIAFLGVNATGLQEYRPNRYDPLYPGIEFHAAVVDNILTGDFLRRPSWTWFVEALSILFLGIAVSAVLACSGPLVSTVVPILLIGLAVAASQTLLVLAGILVSSVPGVLTVLLVLPALSLYKYAREKLKSDATRRQVMASQEATIEGFCAMSEYRDPETGAHIKRTQNYVKALAQSLRSHPRFQNYLDDDTIEIMYKAAPLHDVGKIGIPDNILLKPGKLDDEEFEIMKRHPEYGAQVFELIQKRMGENDFLRIAIEIILGHQEKWDGSGYPRGLAGDAIPVSARLMALADVYDALISRRVYKPPFPHFQAVKIIAEGKGKHFDPDMVEAFLKIQAEFKRLALCFLDSEEQKAALLQNDPSLDET